LAGEGNLGLLQNIGNFKTSRVQEIGILLYFTDRSEQQLARWLKESLQCLAQQEVACRLISCRPFVKSYTVDPS